MRMKMGNPWLYFAVYLFTAVLFYQETSLGKIDCNRINDWDARMACMRGDYNIEVYLRQANEHHKFFGKSSRANSNFDDDSFFEEAPSRGSRDADDEFEDQNDDSGWIGRDDCDEEPVRWRPPRKPAKKPKKEVSETPQGRGEDENPAPPATADQPVTPPQYPAPDQSRNPAPPETPARGAVPAKPVETAPARDAAIEPSSPVQDVTPASAPSAEGPAIGQSAAAAVGVSPAHQRTYVALAGVMIEDQGYGPIFTSSDVKDLGKSEEGNGYVLGLGQGLVNRATAPIAPPEEKAAPAPVTQTPPVTIINGGKNDAPSGRDGQAGEPQQSRKQDAPPAPAPKQKPAVTEFCAKNFNDLEAKNGKQALMDFFKVDRLERGDRIVSRLSRDSRKVRPPSGFFEKMAQGVDVSLWNTERATQSAFMIGRDGSFNTMVGEHHVQIGQVCLSGKKLTMKFHFSKTDPGVVDWRVQVTVDKSGSTTKIRSVANHNTENDEARINAGRKTTVILSGTVASSELVAGRPDRVATRESSRRGRD